MSSGDIAYGEAARECEICGLAIDRDPWTCVRQRDPLSGWKDISGNYDFYHRSCYEERFGIRQVNEAMPAGSTPGDCAANPIIIDDDQC